MPRRADVRIDGGLVAAHYTGAGTNYLVQTPSGVLYSVHINGQVDLVFRKSADGGVTWSKSTLMYTGTCTSVAVWYDRWSNINAGRIHVAWTESGTSDTHYRTIDTESSDALSNDVVVFAGTSTAAGGHLSITRAVGGNVYVKTVIDAGAEGDFFRLTNANVPNGAWDNRAVDEAIATTDQMILLPDFDAADTQDVMAVFWDASANEISRKLYDDSADSWAETSIATSMADVTAANTFPHFAVAPDIANTRHVLVAWSGVDTANADLRCWTIDSGAITEVTNVVLNSTDDQGLCTIQIDLQTGWWYVFYGGKSDGSETWASAVHWYMKVSQDQGTTWGAETLVDTHATTIGIRTVYTVPRLYVGPFLFAYGHSANTFDLSCNVDRTAPRATYAAGIF